MCPLRMGYDAAIRAGNTMMPKSAIVLAAGLGTRMRPHNGQLPKPLVAVGGKSLIDYGLDRLADAGVERAVVNVHYLADALEQLATALGISNPEAIRIQQIDVPSMEISSRDLRKRAAEGRSLLFLVPRAVEVFIREKNIYRA